MKLSTLSLALSAALTLAACGESNTPKSTTQVEQTQTQESPQAQLNGYYEQAMAVLYAARPTSATQLGIDAESIGGKYSDRLDDYSSTSEAKMRSELAELAQKIAAVSTSDLSTQAQENQQVMINILEYYSGSSEFSIGYIDGWMGLSPFVINQINGPLIDVPGTLRNAHQVNNLADAKDYLARLNAMSGMVDQVIEKFETDAKSGWLPSKVTLNGALNYLGNFLKPNAADHGLVQTFKDKLAKTDIDAAEQDKLIKQATQTLTDVVYPAYQKVVTTVEAKLESASDNHGIWAQPNGEAYYQDAIVKLGDSTMNAEQIHQIGLDEVARITKQMDEILQSQGYTEGSVGERVHGLTEDPKFLYPDSDEGRAQLLADLNVYIAEITEKMAPYFQSVPPYDVEVRAFPVEVQDGAPGGQYSLPTLDGSAPGIYWINLRDMKANPTFGLKTLTYHEANPGHHWQVALNLSLDSLPFLRRVAPYNAYVEGWALYSELVAKEIGMYENDPMGDLGRLQAELFRAVRLVVDTGLHHKRWTREQAIDYMASTTGTAQSDVIAEIERYMTWPGQALGYKLGMLKIVALREEAKVALGEKFDLAKFHDLVLLGGAVPMKVLEMKVKNWVASQQ